MSNLEKFARNWLLLTPLSAVLAVGGCISFKKRNIPPPELELVQDAHCEIRSVNTMYGVQWDVYLVAYYQPIKKNSFQRPDWEYWYSRSERASQALGESEKCNNFINKKLKEKEYRQDNKAK